MKLPLILFFFTQYYSAQVHPYYYMKLEWIHFIVGYTLFYLVNVHLDCFQGFASVSNAAMSFLLPGVQ